MTFNNAKSRAWLLAGAAAAALTAFGAAARAEDRARFDIPPQSLETALKAFSVQSHQPLLFTPDLTDSKVSPGVSGAESVGSALGRVLNGTGLTYRRSGDTFLIVRAAEARAGAQRIATLAAVAEAASPTGTAAPEANVVQELVVTAQKKEEAIQTVPIAISAFTQKSLDAMKIEGGFDLLKAIPNVTFSKNNFTGYNFSIRGIGTKAISATTDPGVAVAFNNTALIQNRLFEQEYFDVERVEVLRGPQGTLYGRNATSGVINVISAKPTDHFEGMVKAEVGNYQSRRASAVINIPIIGDKLDVRLAGAATIRDGYGYNDVTQKHTDGRDLWSGRLTVGFKPIERLHGNFIWEHFDENDDRSRTGKQLCHHDDGLTQVGSYTVNANDTWDSAMVPAMLSQGCKPGSLYDASAFGTPNGLALPFVFGMLALGADCSSPNRGCTNFYPLGLTSTGAQATLLQVKDPYGGLMQSPDLRTISSFRDPRYRAKADVFELNFDFDITPSLTFTSQTAYDKDQVYSFQDFNRFNTVPVFTDTAQLHAQIDPSQPSPWANLAPGGVLCDPQLGCSKSIAGFDISQAKSSQYSQEFRIQSSFSGPINFSVGVNYTKFNVLVDYYVMYNLITAFAKMPIFNFQDDPTKCTITFTPQDGLVDHNPPVDINTPGSICPYTDPNPVESINGEGHNYFRSKNPYRLKSGAVFGEVYWQATDTLKVTAGLRYTDDRKIFTPVPSQVLTAPFLALGTVNTGYPELPDIKQQWREVTGRFGADWTPHLSFTDQTMVYAFYSRGYKGGGANPPGIGFVQSVQDILPKDYGPTFEPEFVNAFEVGAKNTLLGGSMILNSDVFFYDYKDYQVSQIKDRTAVNENFDAHVWGAELETIWQPSRDLRINANLGYLGTSIADGETSIDLMNRTQSNPNYVLFKPWVQFPSNCVVPVTVAEARLQENQDTHNAGTVTYWNVCSPGATLIGGSVINDPATGLPYDPANYPEINGGAGILAKLGGNQLPNAPHWTFNIGAEYTLHLFEGWNTRIRGDFYHQSQSWARVYNDDPYDKLHGWKNANVSLTFERPDDGLAIEVYVKNVFNDTPITDAFLNSDDTALTTNIFVLDPRLVGFSIKKTF